MRDNAHVQSIKEQQAAEWERALQEGFDDAIAGKPLPEWYWQFDKVPAYWTRKRRAYFVGRELAGMPEEAP